MCQVRRNKRALSPITISEHDYAYKMSVVPMRARKRLSCSSGSALMNRLVVIAYSRLLNGYKNSNQGSCYE